MSGHMLMDEEFVAVFPSLIARTGSASRAIVLQTLWFARRRDSGETVMTFDQIAARTGLSRRSVIRATDALKADGYLTRRRRGAYDSTSVWAVIPEALTGSADVAPPGLPIGHVEDADVALSESADVALPSYKNQEEELLLVDTSTPDTDLTESFEVFWKAYPPRRKTAKAKALTIWRRLTPAQRDKTMRQLRRACASRDWTKDNGEFAPAPVTWLNRKPWEDDEPEEQGVARSTPKPRALTEFDLVEMWDWRHDGPGGGPTFDQALGRARDYLADCDTYGWTPNHDKFAEWRHHK